MFQKSIRQKIIGIAAGLIVLAVITSVLSIVLTSRVAHLFDEVTNKYIPAYDDLARVNIRSLERSLALRRMIIAKMQSPDDAGYAASFKTFEEKDRETEVREIDRLVVVGQADPQVVFEIMGRRGEITTEQMQLRSHYSDGLAAYRERRWDDALEAFAAALAAVPGDQP